MQRIEFVRQLKNVDARNVDSAESLFILTILEKFIETSLKFSQECVTML